MKVTVQDRARFAELETNIERSAKEVGKALLEIRDEKLYKKVAGFSTFQEYCRERWQMSRPRAYQLIDAAQIASNLSTVVDNPPTSERQVRPLTTLEPEEQREAWFLATQADPKPTATVVAQAVEEVKERHRQTVAEKAIFNQVNDNIGWAKWSWNPVTGCLHNCDYCYARDIANRFYPEKFDPTFHEERLEAPANTKVPRDAENDPAWRRVFTCSMADLFGKWVPQKWITAVFDAIQAHQEWEFLCLTKFPQRLGELDWPMNVWAGTTVDVQSRVPNAEKSFAKVKAGIKWLSCEPLLEPLKFSSLAMFDWVVIGASTGSTLAAPFAPQFDWVIDLYSQAKSAGCKVYLKHNLFGTGCPPGMQGIKEWPR
jgi:protein gp37